MQSSLYASANNSSMRELSVTDMDKTTNLLKNGLLTKKSWKVNSFRRFYIIIAAFDAANLHSQRSIADNKENAKKVLLVT